MAENNEIENTEKIQDQNNSEQINSLFPDCIPTLIQTSEMIPTRIEHISSLERSLSLINQKDIEIIHFTQRHILDQLERSNAKLAQVNKFSIHRFIKLGPQIKRHTRTLVDTKKELDSIFRRIRILQGKIQSQYPDHFKRAASEIQLTYNLNNDDD